MSKPFNVSQFTATEFCTAQDKADFANKLAHFVESEFKYTIFYLPFYRRLSMCFGHIAHYNRDGFYDEWFSTPEKQKEWVYHVLRYNPCGSPEFTFVDVEREFQKWLLNVHKFKQ